MTKPLAFIVEDDPRQASVFEKVFTTVGYEVEMFARGDEAVARLGGEPPKVILLDLHLPFVAGSEILTEIRKDERYAGTFIIVATADLYMAKGDVQEQANKVIIKPVRIRTLRSIITDLL